METRIGNYEIIKEIGKGGFATIYLARHSTLQKEIALKVLKSGQVQDEKNRERFIREARAASALEHPRIVKIDKLIEDENQICIAMEYFPKGDLRQYVEKHLPLSNFEVIRILGQVAEALDYAHSRGVLHRDVKPANILMDEDGNAYLSDFGLVRQSGDPHLTQIGSMVGTATYTSPEQAQGRLDLTGSTDQYSLAVVAYELLVGKIPFEGDNSTAIALLHVTKAPPIPSSINPAVTTEMDEVLLRGLAKSPASRYSSCTEFVHALEGAIQTGQVRYFRELLAESRVLIEKNDFAGVREKLLLAKTILPDRPEMQTMLVELEQTRQNAQDYEQCNQILKNVEQKAVSILNLYPNYPDPQGLFDMFNLRPQKYKKLFDPHSSRQIIVGLIAGWVMALLLFLVAYQIITL
jgi:serine/threonine-protein kinase